MKSGLSSSHFRPVTVTVTRPRPRIRADAGNMHEPIGACLAGKLCHSFGGPHMEGLKCILPALDVEAHRVNDSPGTADSTGDQAIVVYVGIERHDVGAVAESR